MNILKNSPIRNARGMTLMEILIVLAIVGSMLAVIGGNVMENFQKSKKKETKIILSQVAQALQMYYSDCGKMPSSLNNLMQNPGEGECADWGPEAYVKKDLLKDAWKHDLVYSAEGSNFSLKSLGKDGREGGTKYDKDISFEEEDQGDK